MNQAIDLGNQGHVLRTVVAPAAASFDGLERRKLLFPIAKHVLAYAEALTDFANGAKGVGRLSVSKVEDGTTITGMRASHRLNPFNREQFFP